MPHGRGEEGEAARLRLDQPERREVEEELVLGLADGQDVEEVEPVRAELERLRVSEEI